ncbi:MAG: hypothetical protein ACPGYT_00295 [Nitrospirales bacterium]
MSLLTAYRYQRKINLLLKTLEQEHEAQSYYLRHSFMETVGCVNASLPQLVEEVYMTIEDIELDMTNIKGKSEKNTRSGLSCLIQGFISHLVVRNIGNR